MNILVKSSNNKLHAFIKALFTGALYGILPYFLYDGLLVVTGMVERGGILQDAAIYLSVLIFFFAALLNYRDNIVNSLELTDTEIIYTHTKWGHKIVSAINLPDIKSIYVKAASSFPGGARLVIESKNPMESFLVGSGSYSHLKLLPIVNGLKQTVPHINDVKVWDDYVADDPKKSLRRIVVGVVTLVTIGVTTTVLAVIFF